MKIVALCDVTDHAQAQELADSALRGMRRSGYTISGRWAREDRFVPSSFPGQRIIVIPTKIRLFGVDWYAERLSLAADVEMSVNMDADGLVVANASLLPTSDVRVEKAEWWRRAGYLIFWRWC